MTHANPGETEHHAHRAYVQAVIDALTDHGVWTEKLTLMSAPSRQALMKILVNQSHEKDDAPRNTAWDELDTLVLRWHEGEGWAWQARYLGDSRPRGRVYLGREAVPRPPVVAHWMVIALADPHSTPSVEDHPFATKNLDELLRGYEVVTEP